MQDLFRQLRQPHKLLPGIAFALILMLLARRLATYQGFKVVGPMVLAILLGMLVRAVFGLPQIFRGGTAFSARWLLRGAIILMGVRLHFARVISLGPAIILLDAAVVVVALLVIRWLASLFKVPHRVGTLIACGTGICGAAAIAATAPTVGASEDETAFSIAVIATLGTLGTVIYTYLFRVLTMTPDFYGTWVGSTLHEVAHVVAAAVPAGQAAGDIAVLVKLGRVALLVPAVLYIGLGARKGGSTTKVAFPLFVLGFLGVSILTTYGVIPAGAVPQILVISQQTLAVAMAAIGLGVDTKAFIKMGPAPLVVGIIGSAIVSVLGAVLTVVLM